MTPRNFPPADQCSPEDIDAIADLVVRDPSASWGLAGSREHIEALCRRYQALAQDLSAALKERDAWSRRALDAAEERDAGRQTIVALELALAAAINDLDAARKGIAAREDEIGRINNERQTEVNEAAAQRERADEAESIAEIFEATARAALTILGKGTATRPVDLAELVRAVDGRVARALVRERKISAALGSQLERTAMLLDQQAETRRLDEQLRSTCRTVTGRDLGEVNIQLDAELAANPDVGPLHHARDQRDTNHHEGS